MDKRIIEKLQIITPEERAYLDGNIQIKKDIYTTKDIFDIDYKLFLAEGRLISIRPHSRFVEFPVHGHNYIEIMYVCKGTITHYIDGKDLVMQKGDILLLNQHVKHGVKKAGYNDIGINFIALPEFFDIPIEMLDEHNVIADFLVNSLRQHNSEPHYLLFRLNEQKTIENLMENMILSIIYDNSNEIVTNKFSMGLVFLYLVNHIDSLTQNSSQSYKDVVVKATMNYINNCYKTANLSRIAGDFHQSLSALSKMIKQSTGFTFQELLLKKRFQKACMFLTETNLPVEEIAVSIGYENLSYFYRQFRERYGITPRQYRLAHKKKFHSEQTDKSDL